MLFHVAVKVDYQINKKIFIAVSCTAGLFV